MFLPTDFSGFLYMTMVVTSFVTTILYTVNNWKYSLYNKLIVVYLVCFSSGIWVHTVNTNGLLIYFPHLARTAVLFLLLMSPASYFSIDKGLFKNQFSKKDGLHLLPAFIYFLNFLPFYILPKGEKIKIIEQMEISKFSEGWFLPPYTVLILVFLQLLFYFILIYRRFLIEYHGKLSKASLFKIKFFWIYTVFHIVPILILGFGLYAEDVKDTIHIFYVIGNMVFFYLILNKRDLLYARIYSNFEGVLPKEISQIEETSNATSISEIKTPFIPYWIPVAESKPQDIEKLKVIESYMDKNLVLYGI